MSMGEKREYLHSPQNKKFLENKGLGWTNIPQKAPFLYSHHLKVNASAVHTAQ